MQIPEQDQIAELIDRHHEHKFTPSDFYVYVHRRATDGRVFYVGKGFATRAWRKSKRNQHWENIVKKHGYTVEIVQDGMQEWWAFEMECKLIASYGKENLCNKTDGGDGPSGLIWTYESRAKMSESVSGDKNFWYGKPQHPNTKKASIEALKKHRFDAAGKIMKDSQKKNISKSLLGRKVSQETRIKISKTKRIYKQPVFCSNGFVFDSCMFAVDWLKAQGHQFAHQTNIRRCCQGKYKTAYGYTWKYQNENT